MSHLIIHQVTLTSHTSCDVRVKKKCTRSSCKYKCSSLVDENATVIYFQLLYRTKNTDMCSLTDFFKCYTLGH